MPARYVRVLLESPKPSCASPASRLPGSSVPTGSRTICSRWPGIPIGDQSSAGAADRSRPGLWVQDFLDRCLAGENEERLKLALLVMLIRKMRIKPEGVQRVLGAYDPAVVALGHAVADGAEAWPQIRPLVRSSRVSSDLVDAIVSAERADLMALLLECLPTAEPEQQRRALVLLIGSATPPRRQADIIRHLTLHRDPAVRAEAIVLLGRGSSRVAAVRQLIAALDDPMAASAVALPKRSAPSVIGQPPCCACNSALRQPRGRLGSCAHRLTSGAACARRLRPQAPAGGQSQCAAARWIAASWDRSSGWSALELCLRDHQACMVDVVLAALSPAIELRLAHQLRAALRGSDQRRRASAFELIAAVPASRLPAGAVELLRDLLFGNGADARGASRLDGPETVRAQALASMSPWYGEPGRSASRALRYRLRSCSRRACWICQPERRRRPRHGDGSTGVRAHHRAEAHAALPLRAVRYHRRGGSIVQARTYLAGEEVVADGALRQDLLILEAGALTIAHHDGQTRRRRRASVRSPFVASGCSGQGSRRLRTRASRSCAPRSSRSCVASIRKSRSNCADCWRAACGECAARLAASISVRDPTHAGSWRIGAPSSASRNRRNARSPL